MSAPPEWAQDEPQPGPTQAARFTRRQVLDGVSMVMVLAGVAGLTFAGFSVDWRLGMATVCLAILTAGLMIGWDRGGTL